MKFYYCNRCNYNTDNKTKYDRHCKTKKHLGTTKSQQLVNKKSTFLIVNIVIKYLQQNKACIVILNTLVNKIKMKILKN